MTRVKRTKNEKGRRKQAAALLHSMRRGDWHYVYVLVDRKSQTIGYFGVTNDPVKRLQDHEYEWLHPFEKRGRNHGGRMRGWVERFDGRKPEMAVIGAFPHRMTAEVVERCLIGRFNSVDPVLTNHFKYQETVRTVKQMEMLLDDEPFWLIDLESNGWKRQVVKNMSSVGVRFGKRKKS